MPRSLLTMITIKNSDRIGEFHKAAGSILAGTQVLMELTLADFAALAAAGIYKPILSERITLPNAAGIHFRPAAVLSSLARGFLSAIEIERGGDEANAKSVSSIMALNIRHQDQVRLSAAGPDAYEAINILTPAIINGLGEAGATPIQAPASTILPAIAAPLPRPTAASPNRISGISASPGTAAGQVFQLRHMPPEVEENALDPLRERRSLDRALDQTKLHLEALRSRCQAESEPGQAALIAAQNELLDDAELLAIAYGGINRGMSAPFAWLTASGIQAARLEKLDNELLAGRAADLRAAGARVANVLPGVEHPALQLPAGAILIAEDIPAAMLPDLARAGVQAIITVLGGPTTGTAIAARALNMPAIAGIETRALQIASGTSVIANGSSGDLLLNPAAEDVAAIAAHKQEEQEQRGLDLAVAQGPAGPSGGETLLVTAIASDLEEARAAMTRGSDGIGLLLTESLFRDQRTIPSEDEQTAVYSRIALSLPPQKVLTIRTLDSSSLEQLPFLPLAPEPNPALGLRGIRAAFGQPQILRKQCRAVLRASVEANRQLRLLLPMIGSLDEWRAAAALIAVEQNKLEIAPIPVGLLIQTPASALMAGQFAREADFLTIDSSDLAQYTLAKDHSNPHLAAQIDPLSPAVLKLIETAVRGAQEQDTPIALCGALAADPLAIPILIGLGITELVVHAAAVPTIKAHIRAQELETCRQLAQHALSLATAAEVRAL